LSFGFLCSALHFGAMLLNVVERKQMRIRTFVQLAALTGILTLAAAGVRAEGTNIFQATLGETGQKTGEVSTDQMRQIMTDGSAIVLDSRTRAEFDAGHIPGAHVIDATPDNQVAAVLKTAGGDKAKALVLYCNGPYCQASRRLADKLVAAGFSNVRRYQLGIPIWRALGGPTAIELDGFKRVFGRDQTAVFIDARSAEEFTKGSLPGAHSAPVKDVVDGKLKKFGLPEDDFNRRVIVFGRDDAQARELADVLSKRPWHNVAYFPGSYDALAAAVRTK
jgi:rhodanese-related sulfurtransferase